MGKKGGRYKRFKNSVDTLLFAILQLFIFFFSFFFNDYVLIWGGSGLEMRLCLFLIFLGGGSLFCFFFIGKGGFFQRALVLKGGGGGAIKNFIKIIEMPTTFSPFFGLGIWVYIWRNGGGG